jgi:glycosyltransferase involved in cell wall biosynthesis
MPPRPKVLCVGIIEPRKNQGFLLAVAERLWTAGEDFELHFVGRLNPHFGEPVARQIKQAARRWRGRVFHHDAISDTDLLALYAEAQLTAFPTIAEGCGLPLLESLWMGVPCLCSDLPVLRENADAGGCVTAPVNDVEAWTAALTCLLRDDGYYVELCQGAQTRPLPTWASCANSLRQRLLA